MFGSMGKRPIHDQVVVVTGASSGLSSWGQKLSPRAGDLMLLRMGWKSQHTGEDKPVGSPDNLFSTMPGDPGAHGRFDDRSRRTTAWTAARLALTSPRTALAILRDAIAAAGSVEPAGRRGRRPAGVR
jgi:hypothetical protein